MVIIDNRDDLQKATHSVIIRGYDKCLSGWDYHMGEPEYESWAGWACRPRDKDKVLAWVRGRSDMTKVKAVDNNHRPGNTNSHYRIYIVTDGHPAIT